MSNQNLLEQSIALYVEGMPMLKVCAHTGITLSKLQRNLKKRGLSRSNKDNSRRYQVNHQFFSIIDTEQKAYWLGFMYADGFLSNSVGQRMIGLSLAEKDKDHLALFREHLEATYPIKTYTATGFKSGTTYCRLLISSAQLFEDLRAKGAVEHKTFVLTFPTSSQVPYELSHHFIRGYFDGDGSWAKNNNGYSFKLCGTKELLDEVLVRIGFPGRPLYKRREDDKNNWYCSIGGRLQARSIGDWMYRDATVYLQRKYERYLSMKD